MPVVPAVIAAAVASAPAVPDVIINPPAIVLNATVAVANAASSVFD